MHRIVTGSFDDFAGAARGVSALMADGFGHGEISIVALPPPEAADARPDRRRTGALVAGALGAMIGPGSVWAWAPEAGAMIMWAPSLGALIGASLGILGALVLERLALRAGAGATPAAPAGEVVSVVVDAARADRVEAILRGQGATVGRRHRLASLARHRPSVDRAPPPRLVPYRP
jgi:hypothetical protein